MIDRATKRVAEVDFADMCESAKGSTDYMALAKEYHTVFIRNVPRLSMERRDSLRRFIWLIDQLYYHHRKVIIEAKTDIDNLLERGETKSEFDEEFAYERTLSRLKEMQTTEY
jgi:predicted ATPase